jgi:hypothetical protein
MAEPTRWRRKAGPEVEAVPLTPANLAVVAASVRATGVPCEQRGNQLIIGTAGDYLGPSIGDWVIRDESLDADSAFGPWDVMTADRFAAEYEPADAGMILISVGELAAFGLMAERMEKLIKDLRGQLTAAETGTHPDSLVVRLTRLAERYEVASRTSMGSLPSPVAYGGIAEELRELLAAPDGSLTGTERDMIRADLGDLLEALGLGDYARPESPHEVMRQCIDEVERRRSGPGPHDVIVRWQDVRVGDLVVLDDCLVLAERVEIVPKPWGDGTDFTAADVWHRLDNGVLVVSERHGDRYTAVRRRMNPKQQPRHGESSGA